MRLTLPTKIISRPASSTFRGPTSLVAGAHQITSLIHQANSQSPCPCHVCSMSRQALPGAQQSLLSGIRRMGDQVGSRADKEYAFEVAASNIRYGDGVTAEVGMDFANLKAKKVSVFTDQKIVKLDIMKTVLQSLEASGVAYDVYDRCKVEPTDESWKDAISWSRQRDSTHFLAVGGGSVIDTTKAANLFTVYKEAELEDFLNAPVGKGLPVKETLRPLIAIPTTAGTGSETTGSAILDIPSKKFKTGIASRALKPLLGIVDPQNTASCPRDVHLSSGLDVLFHSIESYTAIPYYERSPRPQNPIERPAYQGRNPISDVFSSWALRTAVEMLPRVCKDQGDIFAREQMLLASTFAGIGFGNAGVHLCHAASYPISSQNKTGPKYRQDGYNLEQPLIPHGIAVSLTGPSVFEFTAPSSPERHREIIRVFGGSSAEAESANVDDGSLGKMVGEVLAKFLDSLGGVPRGLKGVGYKKEDLGALVDGMLPQNRVISLSPTEINTKNDEGRRFLEEIIRRAYSW
ncbi:Alcohol dehydrogenase, class IV [Phaffia rhodozyma]|uniref:Alcohol dehydrogenase, class IV n=1 Tax=Phaffia rhodozyma TaxID=264483 RepID=A0A0F7SMF9_PHARH|nr:Alcohol dehydrogenase, class IV [Phaffia rhodozyma]